MHFANCIFLRLGEVSDYTLATFLFIVCAALYYLFSAILSGKIQDWGFYYITIQPRWFFEVVGRKWSGNLQFNQDVIWSLLFACMLDSV